MPCYRPVEAWRASWVNPKTGRRGITFRKEEAFVDLGPVHVPCGRCLGCFLERSRQWAIRCWHESQLHDHNAYLTLTYRPESLPAGGTLVKKHFQDFMKRLRKAREYRDHFRNTWRLPISYFHCGEYGEDLGRPHYHALIFNTHFPDMRFYKNNAQGDPLYKSEELEQLWGHGSCLIGAVTFKSAAYCARYIMKKVTGDLAPAHYSSTDLETGEIASKLPEYITMSLRPAIGKRWLEQFQGDVYPDDFVVVDGGRKAKPPAYYDKQLPPERLREIKAKREARALEPKARADNTPERLAVREEVKRATVSTLKRNLS